MLSRPSGFTGAAVLAAALIAPSIASAAEDREIASDQTIGGDLVVRNLTITATGRLRVPKLSAGATNGWLRVQANTITIFDGGIIDGDGAGHAGVSGANGDAPAGSNGGGKWNATPGLPGGGGGFFGNGASGTQEMPVGTCVVAVGSEGGVAYFDGMMPNLGAAGGSSSNGALSTGGAAGGGGIVLSAASIKIDGTVRANGLSSLATGGVAAGGGSGGTVQIITAILTGGGHIEARGGDGAHGNGSTNPGNMIPQNNGGGGSGGVIILTLPGAAMLPATLHTAVNGGATGTCANAAGSAGSIVSLDLGAACVDLDEDGEVSDQCGGNDCDDTDAKIKPGVTEICDGKDNDCNGKIDDGDDLCAPGSSCVAGKCTDNKVDAGTTDGGTTKPDGGRGSPPDHIEFGGGCSVPGGSATGGLAEGLAGAALLGLGAVALAAGRRPRRRSKR